MKTLTLNTGTFDQENTFEVLIGGKRPTSRTCSLYRDYEKQGDGIYWALSTGGCLKSSYTDRDNAEQVRLASPEWQISHGEIVIIDGKQYKTRVNGAFSNCAVFDPI